MKEKVQKIMGGGSYKSLKNNYLKRKNILINILSFQEWRDN